MTDTSTEAPLRPRLGISACLLGEKVRYDGGHKRDAFLVETLGTFVQWVTVCPEMELGLGTPRETLRLEDPSEAPRLVATRSRHDYTMAMQAFATQRVDELAQPGLHGYILKKDSPSCGMERVRVYNQHGLATRQGRGLFAATLMARWPLLPVEEEGRLQDMGLRENFLERVFAYARWQTLLALPPTPRHLVAFHTRHKLTLLAHSRRHYQTLGRLVAQAGTRPLDALLRDYGATFMDGLQVRATAKKHADVLYHLLGHLKKHLDGADKAELVACIEGYRQGLIPLVVPLVLLQHHFRRHPAPWVQEQIYLHPYPAELMLRNHV